jgi:hypothetical protein
MNRRSVVRLEQEEKSKIVVIINKMLVGPSKIGPSKICLSPLFDFIEELLNKNEEDKVCSRMDLLEERLESLTKKIDAVIEWRPQKEGSWREGSWRIKDKALYRKRKKISNPY